MSPRLCQILEPQLFCRKPHRRADGSRHEVESTDIKACLPMATLASSLLSPPADLVVGEQAEAPWGPAYPLSKLQTPSSSAPLGPAPLRLSPPGIWGPPGPPVLRGMAPWGVSPACTVGWHLLPALPRTALPQPILVVQAWAPVTLLRKAWLASGLPRSPRWFPGSASSQPVIPSTLSVPTTLSLMRARLSASCSDVDPASGLMPDGRKCPVGMCAEKDASVRREASSLARVPASSLDDRGTLVRSLGTPEGPA